MKWILSLFIAMFLFSCSKEPSELGPIIQKEFDISFFMTKSFAQLYYLEQRKTDTTILFLDMNGIYYLNYMRKDFASFDITFNGNKIVKIDAELDSNLFNSFLKKALELKYLESKEIEIEKSFNYKDLRFKYHPNSRGRIVVNFVRANEQF